MYRVAVSTYLYPDGSIQGSAVYASRGPVRHSTRYIEPLHRCWDGVRECPILAAASEAARREMDTANRLRSIRRSVLLMQQHIRTHGLTRLLTFTNGAVGGWLSPDQALDDVMSWILNAGGRDLLGKRAFVCVAEPGGANGRWHVHAAIPNGYRLDYSRIIRSWSAHMTRLGYVSSAASGVHRFHAGDEGGKYKRGFPSARVAANYLAKYLRKALGCSMPPARHRFRTVNSKAATPLTFRCDSLSTALMALGVREDGCYRLEFVNGETGELHLFGLLIDSGG